MSENKNQQRQTFNIGQREYQTSFLNDQTSVTIADKSSSRRGTLKSKRKILPPNFINKSQLICTGNSSIHIQPKLQQLFKSLNTKTKKIYGVNIGNNQSVKQLKMWEKIYLCGCYWLLNLEPIMPKQLTETISRMKEKQNNVDQIRVECGEIKFDKMNKSMIYSRETQSLRIAPRQHNLERLGYPSYEKSIVMIKVGGWSYRFDSTILQVQSTETMIAVRTQNTVNIIYQGKEYHWNIKSCYIKWGAKGLYILKDGGSILLIEIQRQFVKKKMNFELLNDSLGEWCENDFLIGFEGEMILVSPNRNSLILKVINGLQTKVNLLDLEEDTIIHYANGYCFRKELIIFFVIGKNNLLEEINQFSFIMV